MFVNASSLHIVIGVSLLAVMMVFEMGQFFQVF